MALYPLEAQGKSREISGLDRLPRKKLATLER